MTKSKVAIVVLVLIVLDQALKIWVKTHMTLDESITVFGNWFFIRFIENPGAAFGFQLGGDYGKLILSIGRLIASGMLIWYIGRLIKKGAPTGIVVGFSMILVGALGNIFDSVFYGVMFSESTYTTVATMFADGGGYAGLLHGKVVDMFYFPLFSGVYPSWFPWVGGDAFTFFSPIFNLADSYITCGVIYMMIFQHKYFK